MSTLSRSQQAQIAKEIEAARPIPEWNQITELRKWKEQITFKGGEKKTLTFDQLVTKYKEIGAEIDYRDNIRKELKEAIHAALLSSGEDAVLAEGYKVQMITKAGSRKIEPTKLLELGVSADTIAKATVIGAGSSYIDIRRAKED